MAKGGGGAGGQFLAVAFTDVNGDGKFSEKKGDALIAAIVDTDKSKDISIGDTVEFGTYPHLDGSQAGTFLHPEATITAVDSPFTGNVFVDVEVGGEGGTIQFLSTNNFEVLNILDGVGLSAELAAQFSDVLASPGVQDRAYADSTFVNIAHPNVSIDESAHQQGDDGFIDIFFADGLFA